MKLSREQTERAERDMNALTARINQTARQRDQSKAAFENWKDAAKAFHTYENQVFLLWQSETLNAIRAGAPDEVESALTFLEADPYFFRSGYLKEKVLPALKNAPLSKRDESRLQMIVLRALVGRFKREFKCYSRLIPRLHTPQFEAELRAVASRARCPNHARLTLLALDNLRH